MNGAARTMTLRALLAVICAVGMAAVLLLPAALDILSTEKDAGSFAEEQISVIDLSLEGLLYSAYGCGLTLLVLYGLLLALWDKKKRCISAAVLTGSLAGTERLPLCEREDADSFLASCSMDMRGNLREHMERKTKA